MGYLPAIVEWGELVMAEFGLLSGCLFRAWTPNSGRHGVGHSKACHAVQSQPWWVGFSVQARAWGEGVCEEVLAYGLCGVSGLPQTTPHLIILWLRGSSGFVKNRFGG